MYYTRGIDCFVFLWVDHASFVAFLIFITMIVVSLVSVVIWSTLNSINKVSAKWYTDLLYSKYVHKSVSLSV